MENKIAKAKTISITTLYTFPLKNLGGLLRGKCPFHGDSNMPNFTIYPSTNTFYCFACGVGGDSIKFYMLSNNCDFKTAVKELCRGK